MDFSQCLMQSVIRWKGWIECLHSGGSFSAVHTDSKQVVLLRSQRLPIFFTVSSSPAPTVQLWLYMVMHFQDHIISLLYFFFTVSFLFLASHTSSSLSGTEPVSPFFPLPSFYSPTPPNTESTKIHSSHAFCDHGPRRRFSYPSNALCTLRVFSANSSAWLPAHSQSPGTNRITLP